MKAPIEWYKGKGGGERGWKGAMPPLQKFKTLSKIWRSTAWLASKLWTTFSSNLLGRELGKCKMWERAFFFYWDSLKNTVLHKFQQKKRIALIDWAGGPDGKYLGRGHDVRTKRSDFRAPWPSAKCLPVWLKQTQSIRIFLYNHKVSKISKILFQPELDAIDGRTQKTTNTNKKHKKRFYNKNLSLGFSSRSYEVTKFYEKHDFFIIFIFPLSFRGKTVWAGPGRPFPDLLTSQLLLRFFMGLRAQGRTVIW